VAVVAVGAVLLCIAGLVVSGTSAAQHQAARSAVSAASSFASTRHADAPSASARPTSGASLAHAWPDDVRGPSWFGAAGMRLKASEPGRFVTARPPLDVVPDDLTVAARFRKVGGPSGGGYGVIVRDQASSSGGVAADDQLGTFVVAEVGDRGEFGVWQRQGDRWLGLVPWTASDVVRRGGASNELQVRAAGGRVQVAVNGIPMAVVDTPLTGGQVGAFVGGDLNDVVLERFALEPDLPASADDAGRQGSVAPAVRAAAAEPDWSLPRLPIRLDPEAFGRVRALMAGIADDVVAIVHEFFDNGLDDPRSPLHDPAALHRASEHLGAAQHKAIQLADELQRLRSTDEDPGAG
jgi:hypothetical protein